VGTTFISITITISTGTRISVVATATISIARRIQLLVAATGATWEVATDRLIRSLAEAIGGSTIRHIEVGLRTETVGQPTGSAALRGAIRWPIGKQMHVNNWVGKVATWLAIAGAEPEPPMEEALARAIEQEAEALAIGPEAAGPIGSEAAISHAAVAATGMFLEAAAGDTTELDLAVAAVAAHRAWGREEALVVAVAASVAVVVGGAGRRSFCGTDAGGQNAINICEFDAVETSLVCQHGRLGFVVRIPVPRWAASCAKKRSDCLHSHCYNCEEF
jgi:hypothetical protein